ncbi:NAD(P)/FAD-dependent oxidoreductase [Halomonas sp. 86]|uniref:NAD(P)/FAD-dependent oxidoreductase n=1 Tax=unclassified Halomonas TaxID=2609666 RepID=UPI00403418E1
MIESYYSDTLKEKFNSNSFNEKNKFDVCIVGGGITALSCAQTLIENGVDVAIIEKNLIFSGASGLNGGFVVPGYALGLNEIENKVGMEGAKELFKLALSGVNRIKKNIYHYNIESAQIEFGKIDLLRYQPSTNELDNPERMSHYYSYKIEPIEKKDLQKFLHTRSYQYGFLHPDAFHIHPLNYGTGVANRLKEKGVSIYENNEVKNIKKTTEGYALTCSSGEIKCQEVIVCTGGYPGKNPSEIKNSILPITTYVVTSEPNDDIPNKFIKTKFALGDNRQASDYYRIVDNNRVLWGGKITAFPTNNKTSIENKIRKDISNVFPALSNIKFRYSWSGIMGYSAHKMPYIGKLKNGIWYCTAFGGRGLGSGTAYGDIVAKAVLGQTNTLHLLEKFGLRQNYGVLGKIAVEATYKKYIAKDYIKENFNKNKNWSKK